MQVSRLQSEVMRYRSADIASQDSFGLLFEYEHRRSWSRGEEGFSQPPSFEKASQCRRPWKSLCTGFDPLSFASGEPPTRASFFRFYDRPISLDIASQPYVLRSHTLHMVVTRTLSQDSRPPSSPLPLLAGSSVSTSLKLSAGVMYSRCSRTCSELCLCLSRL